MTRPTHAPTAQDWGHAPRLQRLDEARIENMIRSNFFQDLVTQAAVLGVGVVWFSYKWFWAIWVIRWVVVIAIAIAWVAIRAGRVHQALLFLAGGHVVGVIGLVAIVPVLTPLGMLILAGDLFLGSYLHEPIRRWYFFVMVPLIAGIAALSFQAGTDLAERTPRTIAIVLIVAHTLSSGFFIPRGHRQHHVQLRLARDRLTASDQRLLTSVLAERASIARSLEAAPVTDITVLLNKLQVIRNNLSVEPQVAANIADAAAAETQDALRSLRRISHGVFPELLQSGLHEALRQLMGTCGVSDRFEVPKTRLPSNVESAVYMAVRELVVGEAMAVNSLKSLRNSLVIELDDDRLHLYVRLAGVHLSPNTVLPSMPTDRMAAVGGESLIRADGNVVEFLANIPTIMPTAIRDACQRDLPDDTTVDSRRILRVFTTWALRAALVGTVGSIIVMISTSELSAVLVVATFACFSIGAVIGARLLSRGSDGAAIASMCLIAVTSAVFATALATELAPLMALIVSLPTTFALPILDERRLDLVALVQAVSLALLTVIGYLNAPLIEPVVPFVVPAILVPLGAGAVALLIAATLLATVRTVTDASANAIASLTTTVHAADVKRQSIERDLHDGAQQLFVAVSMQFRVLAKWVMSDADRALQTVDTIESLLGQARLGLINAARGTLVPELDEGRLADALRRGIGSFGSVEPAGHDVKLNITGVDTVAPDLANAVYFCCNEALQNAIKHGGPQVSVTVTVDGDDDRVTFAVADNGVGFNTDLSVGGYGLSSIAERIAELHGELSVSSVSKSGTVVSGAVPYRQSER